MGNSCKPFRAFPMGDEEWMEMLLEERRKGRARLKALIRQGDHVDWALVVREAEALHRNDMLMIKRRQRRWIKLHRKKKKGQPGEVPYEMIGVGAYSVNLLTLSSSYEEETMLRHAFGDDEHVEVSQPSTSSSNNSESSNSSSSSSEDPVYEDGEGDEGKSEIIFLNTSTIFSNEMSI